MANEPNDLDKYRAELEARAAAVTCAWRPSAEQVRSALDVWGGPGWQEEANELGWTNEMTLMASAMLRAGVGEAMDWSSERIRQLQADLTAALADRDRWMARAAVATVGKPPEVVDAVCEDHGAERLADAMTKDEAIGRLGAVVQIVAELPQEPGRCRVDLGRSRAAGALIIAAGGALQDGGFVTAKANLFRCVEVTIGAIRVCAYVRAVAEVEEKP